MFESLIKHLPAIENAEGFGNWVVDRESKGTMDDPITMPYVNYGTTVADVEQAIYDFVDEHPEYELTHYHDILERNGLEWDSQAMSGADVSELDGQAVMALLLGAVSQPQPALRGRPLTAQLYSAGALPEEEHVREPYRAHTRARLRLRVRHGSWTTSTRGRRTTRSTSPM